MRETLKTQTTDMPRKPEILLGRNIQPLSYDPVIKSFDRSDNIGMVPYKFARNLQKMSNLLGVKSEILAAELQRFEQILGLYKECEFFKLHTTQNSGL